MALEVQEARPLSPLERAAVKLVFEDSLDPCDVYVIVHANLGGNAGSAGGSGQINISKASYQRTDALDIDSTVSIPKALKPENIAYLSTVVHESAHHWESNNQKYTHRGPYEPVPYDFSWEELQTLKFRKDQHDVVLPESQKPLPEPHDVRKEQHASMAQVYFTIAWQLEHLPDGSDVDLTPRTNSRNGVGPTHRYHRIQAIDDGEGRLVVTNKFAKTLKGEFSVFIEELQAGGIWAG